MKRILKKIPALILASCLLFLIAVPVILAQTEYIPLAPLPGTTKAGSASTTAETYLPGLFRLFIGIATVLAVIMIIVGGIKYMTSDAWSKKDEGKKDIKNALGGLLLVIGAWLILFTVNPELISFDLRIKTLETGADFETDNGDGTGILRGKSNGLAWPDDTEERRKLGISANTNSNVRINAPTCIQIGQVGCTSLHGLNPSIISSLLRTVGDCQCFITITGGTEYWRHGNKSTEIDENPTHHKPGGDVIDLRLAEGQFREYLKANGTKVTERTSPGCAPGAERYILRTALYVNEGSTTVHGTNYSAQPHWHVCFNYSSVSR